MEISLEAGDVIEVIEKRVDGWWRGRCQGKEGLFPSHFVVELDPDGGTSLEASRNRALTGNSSTESKLLPLCIFRFPPGIQNQVEGCRIILKYVTLLFSGFQFHLPVFSC